MAALLHHILTALVQVLGTRMDPSPLTVIALGCAIVSASILVGYLVLRPRWTRGTKLALLLGLGVFPIGAAAAGNVQGFEATKEREFCGACHVMSPHKADSDDPRSTSLSSRHARNELFGSASCYACHADYGMFGTVLTKLGGMRHVWLYYTGYRSMPIEQAREEIHLRNPFPNANCMHCHSATGTIWNQVPDHAASLPAIQQNRISCASEGCHGYAHPNFRPSPSSGASR